jgi:HMG (high mobility group) box
MQYGYEPFGFRVVFFCYLLHVSAGSLTSVPISSDAAPPNSQTKLSTTDVAKMVSQAWKDLSEDERERWEEMARQDKARFEMEKSMYTGPWKVPATKRTGKDPTAPKRPMSAFLSFSNSKRSQVKAKFKDTNNAEISRILARMWKESPPEDKSKFIDEEYRLRQDYKIAMAEWKRQSEAEFKSKRAERENQAMQAVREGKLPIRADARVSFPSTGIDSATTDNTLPSSEYNSRMADDTFGSTSMAPDSASAPHGRSRNHASPIPLQAAPNAGSSSDNDVDPRSIPQYSYYQYPQQHYSMNNGSFDTTAFGGSYHPQQNQERTGYDHYYNSYGTRPYDGANGAYPNSHGQPNPYGYVPANYNYGKARRQNFPRRLRPRLLTSVELFPRPSCDRSSSDYYSYPTDPQAQFEYGTNQPFEQLPPPP